ncbi:MAG: proton-conducting transporter membrane subunit [Candidatus Methanospirare jalkutatii]|nr:proton-conducting transporter membrane subunit [Candidatus Methanospirare jalkutatii]
MGCDAMNGGMLNAGMGIEEISAFLIALIILVLGSVFSYKYHRLGLITAVIAVFIGFLASSFISNCFVYAVFILAIALLNLFSLEALPNEIKGVDFGLVGLIALATFIVFSTANLATVLTALVIISVPTYILVMLREGAVNVEIGVKYIVFMVFATVLFLTGAIILASGAEGVIFLVGYVMLVLGLCLEVGVAPLHEWVPDVFTVADPVPVSVIASIAKIVPFVVALRIIASFEEIPMTAVALTAVLAAFSMFVGNIGALTAREHARVLAYSTVANMGYVLACIAVVSHPSAEEEFVYAAVIGALLLLFGNAAGKIGFFNAIKGEGAFAPLLYILAFSFIGVPPLLGFWGKLFILLSLVEIKFYWLAGILVLNSAISIPYYVRLARELGVDWRANIANFIAIAVVIIALITVIPPEWFVQGVKTLPLTLGI